MAHGACRIVIRNQRVTDAGAQLIFSFVFSPGPQLKMLLTGRPTSVKGI